ncbi:Type II/IV secretion system protein [Planctomycetes bacterium Pan216]|uniref:Type II/IV secretion system protein n=1 Tax=Kolteria novifilia TaxID=2527975 RepID=A0A518B004_9BACT|nr:Type II/IV secretion system protein [Planctomycetes bacterium Pan216]
MATGRGDFADILIQKNKISAAQRAEALAHAQSQGTKLRDAFVELGHLNEAEVLQAVAQERHLSFIDLEDHDVPPDVIELVPESVARENNVLPVSRQNGTLSVATSDPDDISIIDKLRFILNQDVELTLGTKDAITAGINRHYGLGGDQSNVDSIMQEMTRLAVDTMTADSILADDDDVGTLGTESDSEAPIVRLVNLIVGDAVQKRASDVHIEPFEDRVRVRYRIDGQLVEQESPPRRLLGAMLTRIKILAKIDITEKRRPQDGRIKSNFGGKILDLRVSVLPTNHGQSIVMRLLDQDNIKISVRDLGFGDDDYRRFSRIIKRPNGIFLVTGPTGSGKTTTLYAALNELNRPDRKIITAEDPVEYYLPGVNQVQVRASIGFTFQSIIKAMLRQAPNIILVGEIRDKETAEIAIQASLTGHLVFSTLHTNDAPGSVTRLIDMGVQPFLVASSLMAVLAQRLVRKVCVKCKEPVAPTADELRSIGINPDKLKRANFSKGKGCKSCNKSGYRGRIGIYELMAVSQAIRELTFKSASHLVIRRQARSDGMRTLFQDGLIKAIKGITSIEEVIDVAGMDKE